MHTNATQSVFIIVVESVDCYGATMVHEAPLPNEP
jgi:hypothetical protein